MKSRTVRDFTVPTDIWPAVDNWATTEGFTLIDDNGSRRAYAKTNGTLAPTFNVEIGNDNEKVHLEAWLTTTPFGRALSFFTKPEEVMVESGGSGMLIPRATARDRINRLMIQLGQPLIT
jgi:hypothetical protein